MFFSSRSFVKKFNAFFEAIIFITFGLGILWICSALFQLQYVS